MEQEHLYSLDTISSLLNIPKSTLRYWEKEKIITSCRNEGNDYRKYTTSQLIDICEIKFYRDLNFSIKDIEKLFKNDAKENKLIIEDAKNGIISKIKELEQVVLDIENYQYKHELVNTLKNRSLTKERPIFEKLYYFHPAKTPNLINYLKDPSMLTFVISTNDRNLQHFSTFEKDSAVQPSRTFWTYDSSKEYFCLLLTANENELDELTLNKAISDIQHSGYLPEQIIGRYLTTQKLVDYYQVWIEAKKDNSP